jgi:uncharacterized membrane protein
MEYGSTRDSSANRRVIGLALTGVAAGIALAQLSRRRRAPQGNRTRGEVRVEHVTTINRPIAEVYDAWKDFERFPRFMRHLEAVQVLSDRRSLWRARAPGGTTVEWEAELVEDRPGERLSWQTVEGSDVEHSGSVTFEHAPGARGTEVRAVLYYSPPAGAVGRVVAKLFGEEPEQQIREDLRRFKQLLETGEIPLSDGPGLQRPAQPPARPEEIRTLAGVER